MQCADLKQTIMRFGGFTDGVRRGNGFTEGVMFLGVQQDLLLFLQYYEFQKEALARGDDWMEGEYPQRFKPVVNSARKHAKKSLRLDEHLAMTTVEAPATTPSDGGAVPEIHIPPNESRTRQLLRAIGAVANAKESDTIQRKEVMDALAAAQGYDGWMHRTAEHQWTARCCARAGHIVFLGVRSGIWKLTPEGRRAISALQA